MQVEPTKLTDTLERQLGAREIDASRGNAFAGGPSWSPLRPLLRVVRRLRAVISFLRSQARRAKVEYVAG
jgi:hypothetical protein